MSELKLRKSNIELLRIIMMIFIIAHHYIMDNSGIISTIEATPPCDLWNLNTIIALCFGSWGKCGVNVFLLITGYFSCVKKFNYKKVLDITLQTLFYYCLIYIVMIVSGKEVFNLRTCYTVIFNIPYCFGNSFISGFIVLYCLSPFINKMINNCSEKEYQLLLLLLLFVQTFCSTFLYNNYFDYIGWYSTVYLIGGYLRLYPKNWMKSKIISGGGSLFCFLLGNLSVIAILFIGNKLNRHLPYYHFVNNANKIFAILPAVMLFLFFNSLDIGVNKIINTFAASTFGILLLHQNFFIPKIIWCSIFNNLKAYKELTGARFLLHAFTSTIYIYSACAFIDISFRKILCLLKRKR